MLFRKILERQLVHIQGVDIEYALSKAKSDGCASIILINGSGGDIQAWEPIWEGIKHLGHVLCYNREGIGKSNISGLPQTLGVMTDTLRNLIVHLQLPPPYIVVGHSFGGLIANFFARSYSKDIQGVVLVESTSPDDIQKLPTYLGKTGRFLQNVFDFLSPQNQKNEVNNAHSAPDLLEKALPFPNVPLVVITGSKSTKGWFVPSMVTSLRGKHQKDLVSLSPKGRHIFAEHSGHFPQLTEPQIIINAVCDITIVEPNYNG